MCLCEKWMEQNERWESAKVLFDEEELSVVYQLFEVSCLLLSNYLLFSVKTATSSSFFKI